MKTQQHIAKHQNMFRSAEGENEGEGKKSKMRVSTKQRFLAAIGFWQIMAAVRIFFVVFFHQCTANLRC
jgi:hypothetical protein